MPFPTAHALLTDTAATRDGILAALDALAVRVGEDDTVFVFYAGHGEYGDDGYYLTTHDTQLVGRKVTVGSGIREAELIAKLRAIHAKRLLLIVNACHAGELSPVLAPGAAPLTGAPPLPDVTAALLGTGAGRVIISACREQQYAFIGPGPLTLFTQALVDGLQGKGSAATTATSASSTSTPTATSRSRTRCRGWCQRRCASVTARSRSPS